MKKVNIDFDVDQFKTQVQEDNEMTDKFLQLMLQSFPPQGVVPKLILVIKEGVLTAVISNTPVQYVLVDWDNIECGDEFPTEINWKPDAIIEDIDEYLLTLNEKKG